MAGGGSKPGERRGGRQKGSRNRKTAALIAKQEASGLMPLDYMLNLLRTEPLRPELPAEPSTDDIIEFAKRYAHNEAVRFDAAKSAAPYLHPRLASTEVKIPQKIVHEVRITIAKPDKR